MLSIIEQKYFYMGFPNDTTPEKRKSITVLFPNSSYKDKSITDYDYASWA